MGVLYLGSLLGSPGVSQMLAQSSLGFMNGLFPFLQVYVQPLAVTLSMLFSFISSAFPVHEDPISFTCS